MRVVFVAETLFLHLLKFKVLEWISGYLGCLPVGSRQMLWFRWVVWLLSFQFIRLDQWNAPVQGELQWAAVAQCCVSAYGVRLCLLPCHLFFWLYFCWCDVCWTPFCSLFAFLFGFFCIVLVDVLTLSTCGTSILLSTSLFVQWHYCWSTSGPFCFWVFELPEGAPSKRIFS